MNSFEILDRTTREQEYRLLVRIPAASPFFEGHFEGRPILPAVAHLALVQESLEDLWAAPVVIESIERARFRAPVAPADELEVLLVLSECGGRVRFDVTRNGVQVSSGALCLRRAEVTDGT